MKIISPKIYFFIALLIPALDILYYELLVYLARSDRFILEVYRSAIFQAFDTAFVLLLYFTSLFLLFYGAFLLRKIQDKKWAVILGLIINLLFLGAVLTIYYEDWQNARMQEAGSMPIPPRPPEIINKQ